MNIFLKKVKEFWINKRYRSLFYLFLFFLSLILLSSIIDFNSASPSSSQAARQRKNIFLREMNNYEYTYIITYLNSSDEPIKTSHIYGKRNGQNDTFQIDNETYYKNKDQIYKVTSIVSPINDESLYPYSIYSYINEGRKIETTQYENGRSKKVYQIEIKKFAKKYANEDIEKIGNVFITTYEKKNQIEQITLDLSQYNNMYFELKFANIANVESFTVEDILANP